MTDACAENVKDIKRSYPLNICIEHEYAWGVIVEIRAPRKGHSGWPLATGRDRYVTAMASTNEGELIFDEPPRSA